MLLDHSNNLNSVRQILLYSDLKLVRNIAFELINNWAKAISSPWSTIRGKDVELHEIKIPDGSIYHEIKLEFLIRNMRFVFTAYGNLDERVNPIVQLFSIAKLSGQSGEISQIAYYVLTLDCVGNHIYQKTDFEHSEYKI